MTVNLPQFFFGILLLWFPRQWMRLGVALWRRRRKSSTSRGEEEPWIRREPGDPRISFRREFGKFRNYFDLLRGAAGSIAIAGMPNVPGSITLVDAADRIAARELLAINLVILFVGLLIQTMRYERHHLTFFAPVFFLAGLSVSLCSAWGALFAFVLIWGLNPMLGSAQAFLTVYGVVMGVFGFLFMGLNSNLPIAAMGLGWLPVLLSLLVRRPLAVISRKASHSADG